MKKKSIQTLTVGLFVFLFLMYATQVGIVPVAAKKAGTITVAAGDDKLIKGTPIIINASLIPDGIAAETAIIMDDDTELPTQYDEDLNELVFQLPSAVNANSNATFDITGESSGSDNGQDATIKIGQGDYAATYDSWLPSWATTTFMNGTTLSTRVTAIKDVIWVETDWGILCLAVEADWRQGTWRHVIMKDAQWDVVGTSNWNATSDGNFQWAASLFQDADEGWQHGAPADTVEIKEVGPVRAVIQIIANSDYKDLLGQSVEDCNATRTYFVYDGFEGIHQHFTLTGDNAAQAMVAFKELNDLEEPLRMKHQMMDGRSGEKRANNLSKVHVPGLAAAVDRGGGAVSLSNFTDSYFAMYNPTAKNGYVYNFADLDNLQAFDPGNEIVMNYAFDAFPEDGLNRFFIPFDSYSSIAAKAASLNTMWTAEYDTDIEKAADSAPGFEFLFSTFILMGVALVIRKRRN